MVSNNTSQYAPYKTYQQSQQSNNYKPPTNNGYNPPANNYKPEPKPYYPQTNNTYKPTNQYDNRVVNTDTAIAWAKKYDADKNGGLNREEIIKTANEAQKHDKGVSEFFNTFIYGGKNKQGFIFDPNKDRLLNFHEIATLAGKDGYANGIVAKDFELADPKQYQPGGNTIPPYGKQPYQANNTYNKPVCPPTKYPPQPPVCKPPVRKPCAPKPRCGYGNQAQQLIQKLLHMLSSKQNRY